MRTPLVVGNWKMHGVVSEARALATAIRDGLKRPRGVDVAVCPPFTALGAVAEVLAGSAIGWGGQNCHWEEKGAFTGEIAPSMLTELGCRYVLLGHSERRHFFRETDEEINRKVTAALRHQLVPVLCLGETEEERRQGLTFTVVEGQLRTGWAGLGAEDIARTVLAYEPVWAIGTGVTATPVQAAEVHGYLRGLVSELASKEIAQSLRILYGGSVKPDNAAELTQEPDIDGSLVGGASLQPQSFITIAKKSASKGGSSKE
ncbi:MAG TPA: triose-phosphate isomerase [Methylomirabilota bacterium]|jgi:triosephosphate isomerase|nr:triose-phosphate isomerase [Methylomirabilota bacterium]